MNKNSKTYKMTYCAMMTTLLCILSPMTIPIGPVPVSLAIFVICLSAYLLGPKYGSLSVIVYLLIGFAGIPVFAGYSCGIAKLAGPTGGFLIGYIFTALVGGLAVEHYQHKTLPSFLGLTAGTIIAYAFGTGWFVVYANAFVWYALSVCVLPFIIIDLIKIAIAVFLGKAILSKSNL